MAKFVFKQKFIAQMDALDEQIDEILAKKAELLLREVQLHEPEYFNLLSLREQLIFEVKDRGMVVQLNGFCDDKRRLKFVQSKTKFMLGQDLFRFIPGGGEPDYKWEDRQRRIRDRNRRVAEKSRHLHDSGR